MNYGLSESTIEKIRGVFARFPEIEKAVLYGSRAKGNFKTGSDIDLTLYGTALTSDLYAKIADKLDDLLLPYSIDLSLFDELDHTKLREHIERVGVVFYERANQGVNMKAGWKKTTLGTEFVTVTGNTPPKNNADFYGNFIPLVKPPELCDRILNSADDGLSETGAKVARTVPSNSILVSCIGNLGKIGLNTIPVALNQQINAILPDNKKAIPEFMFYQVLSDLFKNQLEDLASGTTVSIVNKSKFNSIKIVLPPLPEQQRIVAILDEAFDGIATAKANAEKNLQNARAIFESYLSSVFSQRGEGWVEKRLEQIGTTQTGSTPKTIDIENYGEFISFIKPGDFNKDGTLDYKNYGLSRKGLKQARKVAAGSVLMVCIGATIGKCSYCDFDVTMNQQINSLTPVNSVSYKFVYYQMITEDFQRRILLNSGQTTLPIINKSKWSALTIWLPQTLAEQEVIAIKLDVLIKETQRLESIYQQKSTALDELKKSLLHQAFSGQL